MKPTPSTTSCVAIACGGTGGHLFPGLAVARRLLRRGCQVTLFVSAKEIDRQAVEGAGEMQIIRLPAIGLTPCRRTAFLRGLARSYLIARGEFRGRPPLAALAMGGFTSAPVLLAAKRQGAKLFLHESNAVPGRANRWLSRIVDRAFISFPSAARQLHSHGVMTTGTPVRPEFRPLDPAECRIRLGLDPNRPTILVVGGSQGASGINQLIMASLPVVRRSVPEWQWLHLTGPNDFEEVQRAYAASAVPALVRPFWTAMDIALGAATAAVSRAGASSLAEFAAMQVPAVLIPFPAAADNHQFHNARHFESSGAACLLQQKAASPESLLHLLRPLVHNPGVRAQMQNALAQWHRPLAAEEVAVAILGNLELVEPAGTSPSGPTQTDHRHEETSAGWGGFAKAAAVNNAN